jgi:predicted ATPase/class 3 adenylate cyclase
VSTAPTGTVTFLFTDLEGSTRLWDDLPDAMGPALKVHDGVLRRCVESHGGYLVKMTGDGAHAAFATASDAIASAIDVQLGLQRAEWGATGPLRVRIGMHSGTAEARDGDYFGTAVNRAARLMAAAHGTQIVCSRATADLARDALVDGTSLDDLGDHQLRDLGTPERVYQVTHPHLPADFPPLRTLDAYAGNLPLQVTEFLGREEALADLAKLLPVSRLVTLTGTGGVGKTRLAVQAAASALPHYADGAWFVDLAPIDDGRFIATEIANTMHLPEHRQGDRTDALVAALALRHALLVLDNCEHVVDAVAELVDVLLRRCAHVRVLATSQEVLGVEGEATYPVRPLAGEDATRLFVERAAAARHGFALSSENAAAVEELCRRLDGIPLAIELAGARVSSMSPAAILEHVDERFRLLGQGRRTARRRHQTLRAAVDWSYGLLEPREQLVFDRLSVFAGEFALEFAERVVTDDDIDALDVLDIVGNLVSKSMLQLDERGSGDRYRLLETLRDYGLERLAARGELEKVQTRFLDAYTSFAQTAAQGLVGAHDTEWVERIDDEDANLRAAMLLAQERDPYDFAHLVFALTNFWRMTYRTREGLAWLTAAHDAAPDLSGREVAGALANAALFAVGLTRWEEGRALARLSIERSIADGDVVHPVAPLASALLAIVEDDPEETRRLAEEGAAAARVFGDPFELVWALATAGSHIATASDDPRAVELADEALAVARGLGNTFALMMALQAAGMSRFRTDPTRGIELMEESLTLRSERTSAGDATPRFMKAAAHLMIGDDAGAAHELEVALPRQIAVGDTYYASMSLAATAILARRRGSRETAVRLLAFVERLREEGWFVGATRDLESQQALWARLERELDPGRLAELRTEGRALTLDDAADTALDVLRPLVGGA